MDEAYAEQVLTAVEAIPPGRVATYGDIARQIGAGGPRQVGLVLSRVGAAVPWWRVVRADGRPAPEVASRALTQLSAEAVPVSGGRVDLRRARLTPAEWPALPG